MHILLISYHGRSGLPNSPTQGYVFSQLWLDTRQPHDVLALDEIRHIRAFLSPPSFSPFRNTPHYHACCCSV